MKKLLRASAALLLGMGPAFPQATSSLNGTIPGSGTLFSFCSAVANTPPYWPCVQLRDAAGNLAAVTPLGTTTEAGSIPVTTPTTTRPLDACYYQTRTPVPISTTSAATTLVLATTLSRVYICSGMIKASAATNIGIIEGGGSTCAGGSGGGSTTALAGAITPSTGGSPAGIPLVAGGDGFPIGVGGMSAIRMITPNDSLCLVQSGTALLGGWLSVVITQF